MNLRKRQVLPQQTEVQREALTATMRDPATLFQQSPPGTVLIGVLNIKTSQITLLPCVDDPVWLEMSAQTGVYLRGWKATKNSAGMPARGEPISAEAVAKYNQSPYPPRIISLENEGGYSNITSYIRPHTFMIELMGETENIKNYRGFSIKTPSKPGGQVKFTWNSASLNAVLWLPFMKEMPEKYRGIVVDAINRYNTPTPDVSQTAKNDNHFTQDITTSIEQFLINHMDYLEKHCSRAVAILAVFSALAVKSLQTEKVTAFASGNPLSKLLAEMVKPIADQLLDLSHDAKTSPADKKLALDLGGKLFSELAMIASEQASPEQKAKAIDNVSVILDNAKEQISYSASPVFFHYSEIKKILSLYQPEELKNAEQMPEKAPRKTA